jgi:hypothetical protein
VGYFTASRHPNQRRYEALRAYFTEDLTVEQAGYSRSSMASLLRDFRAGRLELFAPPGKPGPKTAPAKDRARARVLEIRQAGGHDPVAERLAAIPEVLEAHTIISAGDMLCRVVARSNTDLQRVIDAIISTEGVVRSPP